MILKFTIGETPNHQAERANMTCYTYRTPQYPISSTREVASELWGQAIHLIAHPCAVGLGRVYIQSRRRAAQSLEVPLYMMRMCSLRGNASCEGAMNS
ncbi:hypothetical protein HBI56_202890 [Parastagonospora nodorum]|nr:hypothetical protein HBI10_137830 [Parastagonospora nodorum]KAH4344614.1 hypothetical protein HBH98_134690 [Parastagonospora nodorum]KAH4421141.1 hypothetical protein HBH99_052270 [Parastagonospora nodorum]KAH4760473.1 hypothetical protein HBH63_211650 [Parastagonospora nodorum]KAH4899866.1 hypothetical protein HBI80_164800 [Parastagonospora nodorum]